MSKTRWAVDGPAGTSIEINGHKFGTGHDGAPMMCNLVCQDMGRHAHVDYCRADAQTVTTCGSAEIQHVRERLRPNPDQPKDFITHSLFWRRSGMYLLNYMSKGVIQLTSMWTAGFKGQFDVFLRFILLTACRRSVFTRRQI